MRQNIKIFNGKVLTFRGSNKKYEFLDNLDWLYENLQRECVEDFARRLSKEKGFTIPPNSIRFRVNKYFPQEWIDNIVFKRRHGPGK